MTETTIEHGTDIETVLDEALDFEIVCEYVDYHRVRDDCDQTAVWAVWSINPSPCGCPAPGNGFRYFCGSCWTYRNQTGYVNCGCGMRFGCMDNILMVERIPGK